MTPKGNLNLDLKTKEVQIELLRSNFTPKQGSGDKERKYMMPNSVKNIEGKKIVFDPSLLNIASKHPATSLGFQNPLSIQATYPEKQQKQSPTSKVPAPATTPSETLLFPAPSKLAAKKAKFGASESKKNLQLNIDEINKENPFGGEMCEKPAK